MTVAVDVIVEVEVDVIVMVLVDVVVSVTVACWIWRRYQLKLGRGVDATHVCGLGNSDSLGRGDTLNLYPFTLSIIYIAISVKCLGIFFVAVRSILAIVGRR